jgi:hypothetical protein
MSIVLQGSTSGSVTLQEPAVAGSTVLTLPAVSGTVLTTTSPKAGNVIQVVSTTKTDTTSFASANTNTFVDITGMSVTITPTSATSKIFVMFTIQVSQSASASVHVRLVRDSTAISIGDSASNRLRDTVFTRPAAIPYDYDSQNLAANFLDSPSTTSATTYKLQATLGSTYNGTFYLNRVKLDDDTDYTTRTASTITVMEIAG